MGDNSCNGRSRPNSTVDGMSSDQAGNCSYRYAHPGHDRIARELSELRLREDELRGRWKEMGFEVPQVCSENETPFSLPEPIRIPNNSTSLDETDNRQQQQQHETEQLEDTTQQSSTDVTVTSQSTSATPTTSGVKVRPFEDPDADETRQRPRFTYFPADETPIQREIRLQSEREEILRRSRGIVSTDRSQQQQRQSTTDEQLASVIRRNGDVNGDTAGRMEAIRRSVDLEEQPGNATGGWERGSRVSMKLLASSRLAMEIERERQRELDLRKLGCISTISDERACHPPIATDEQVRRRSQNVDAAQSVVTDAAVADPQQLQSVCSEAKTVESDRTAIDAGSSECSISSGQSSPRPRVSTSGAASSGSVVGAQQLRQTTELIERELRELQLREIELRKQRASLTGLTTDNNNDVIADVVTTTSNGDVTQERRRSTLIDQWESRIVKDA